MTNVFSVVGEHRTQPTRWLLLGADGHYYAYATENGQAIEVEPTEEWEIDGEAAALAFAV